MGTEGAGADRGFPGDRRWWLVAGVLPAVLLLAPRLLAVAWADRLPDPVAVHWDFAGTPNGTMPLRTSELFMTGLGILFWILGAAMVRNTRAWRVRRAVAAGLGAALAFLAAMDAAVLVANLDRADWRQSELPLWFLAVALLAAAPVAVLAWVLCGRPPDVDTPAQGLPLTAEPPSAGLPPGTRTASWEGTSTNRWLGLLGAGIGIASLVAAPLVSWWLVLPAAIVVVATATLSAVHVRCDEQGLTVRYGPLGWPVQRIGLAQISRALAVDLDPAAWGGWGYRWLPGSNGTAAVIRSGPAIVVERTDGRRFAVTVDGAVDGAGILNDLRPGRAV